MTTPCSGWEDFDKRHARAEDLIRRTLDLLDSVDANPLRVLRNWRTLRECRRMHEETIALIDRNTAFISEWNRTYVGASGD